VFVGGMPQVYGFVTTLFRGVVIPGARASCSSQLFQVLGEHSPLGGHLHNKRLEPGGAHDGAKHDSRFSVLKYLWVNISVVSVIHSHRCWKQKYQVASVLLIGLLRTMESSYHIVAFALLRNFIVVFRFQPPSALAHTPCTFGQRLGFQLLDTARTSCYLLQTSRS
jgi:hypothetical protein